MQSILSHHIIQIMGKLTKYLIFNNKKNITTIRSQFTQFIH